VEPRVKIELELDPVSAAIHGLHGMTAFLD
jgi:hypothetical protein